MRDEDVIFSEVMRAADADLAATLARVEQMFVDRCHLEREEASDVTYERVEEAVRDLLERQRARRRGG